MGSDAPTFGPYVLGLCLGKGGMGVVHEATAPDGTVVAIKRLTVSTEYAGRTIVQRLLDEAKLGATLDHPNIVKTLDGGVIDGQAYLVMERLRGASLSTLFEAPTTGLRIDLAVGLVDQLLAALDFLGSRGVVHRDVKPSNVFVTETGHVKVIDFGIALTRAIDATATATGVVRGSLPFLAPEYLRGEEVDGRADLYAAALLLHELLTGVRVFTQANHAALLSAILFSSIPPVRASRPEVPAGLDDELRRALAKEPAKRHATAGELRAGLRQAAEDEVAGPEAIASWCERRRLEAGQRTADHVAPVERALAQEQLPVRLEPPAPAPLQLPAPVRRRRWSWALLGLPLLIGAVVLMARALSGPPPPVPVQAPRLEPSSPVVVVPPSPEPAAAIPEPAPPAVRKSEPRRKAMGFFTVDARPTWAQISIDGRAAGPTPLFRKPVTAGSHRVDAVTADGRRQSKTVTVGKDSERRILFEW